MVDNWINWKEKGIKEMNKKIIARASELVNGMAGFKDEFGMVGYASLSLIDENGYPSATTFARAYLSKMSISKENM